MATESSINIPVLPIDVLQSMAEAVVLWHADGTLRFANAAAGQLFGDAAFAAGVTRVNELLATFSDRDGNPLPNLDAPLSDLLNNPRLANGVLLHETGSGAQERWFELGFTALADPASGGAVMSFTDVSSLQQRCDQMARIANYDALTGLPNRALLNDRIAVALAHNRRADTQVAICFIDLDAFKAVNDRFGHDTGDELLKQVAARLRVEIRDDDTVARLGGDEFVVVFSDLHNRWDCEPAIKRTMHYLAEPYRVGKHRIDGISASIGVSLFPLDGDDPETLLRQADSAMYAAKRAGKNRYRWVSRDHDSRLEAQEQTQVELAEGLQRGEFHLRYQPVIDYESCRLAAVEAGLCWQHPILGALPPAHLLPLVGESDLALAFDAHVFEQALQQSAAWHREHSSTPITINLFAQYQPPVDLPDRLRTLLAGCATESVRALRITLSAHDVRQDLAAISEAWRSFGFGCALDGPATQQLNMMQLLHHPFDVMTIDRFSVAAIGNDAGTEKLVEATLAVGRALGTDVIVQGVESTEQADWLHAHGCRLMQGGLFGKPMDASTLAEWKVALGAEAESLKGDHQHGPCTAAGTGV
ncbi:MAG: diguanylate cyclase [Gammaproteobacteria bacterium]|nr:diguanylate cyclase [Gammaproteobacteria bacterium]